MVVIRSIVRGALQAFLGFIIVQHVPVVINYQRSLHRGMGMLFNGKLNLRFRRGQKLVPW